MKNESARALPQATVYYPYIETIIFLLVMTVTIAVVWRVDELYIMILATPLLYFVLMKDAYYIRAGADHLFILSFNPFTGKHIIPWTSLERISSKETNQDDLDEGEPIRVLKREYDLEYKMNNKTHVVTISFSTNQKQQQILAIINQKMKNRLHP
ncbi:MAG: hypothetical protein QM762_09400 [Chryseolinea sp.]